MALARASNRIAMLIAALLSVPVTTACASDFERKFEEAEALHATVAEKGAEWIGTAALLEEAREAAANGDEEAALELVAQAKFQAEAALAQSEREAELWQHRVLR
jgi:hypothetical protein